MARSICPGCDASFIPSSNQQLHCSAACRQRARRRRQGSDAHKTYMAPPLETVPDVPAHLGDGGRQLWATIWESSRWSRDDVLAIVRRCELQDAWEAFSAVLSVEGYILDGKVHPAATARLKLCSELNSLDDRLALNPRASALQAAKMKALMDDAEEPENALDRFLSEHKQDGTA